MRDFSRADEEHYSVWGRACMKIQNAGYIKLHRKFLKSQVRKLNSATVCLFIDLLLLADKDGQIETSYREIQEVLKIGSRHTVINGLEQLKKADAIDYDTNPNLLIKLNNWGMYQARSGGAQNAPVSGAQNAPQVVQKMHQSGAKNAPPKNPHNEVPVQLDKEYKNISKNSKNIKEKFFKTLNFQDPQTDLEKLIRFYLEGTCHPALKKPNANDLLNLAVQQDLPHFRTILANCDNLHQAQECVKKYVSEAKGVYSMFYLAGQINSIRQEVESRDNKRR